MQVPPKGTAFSSSKKNQPAKSVRDADAALLHSNRSSSSSSGKSTST
jgi:hypothetical protein